MPIIVSAALLSGDETALLSPEKQSLVRHQQTINEAEHEKLRTNWIAPLNLSGSYSYDKSAGGIESDTKRLSASISQDIFRSGGITYQISYADANRQVREIALDQEIAALNEQLFTALLTYHKKRYEREQSGKKIENHDIEIFIKKALYDAGKADITELNNALMNKSAELRNAASLEYDIARQRLEIAKLSDVDPDTYPLPLFTLVREEEYLENRLDLRHARAQAQSFEHLYRVSETSYLPSLALNAGAGYQEYDPKTFSGGYEGDYYSVGATLSVPLTYNASATIQEARTTYLKQAAQTADTKRETAASYAQSLELIESYRRYIGITQRNLALYDDLISAAQAGADAGSKTGYDLQTVKNTKAIEEYTIKINELNIQLELAKLHFALSSSKEPR